MDVIAFAIVLLALAAFVAAPLYSRVRPESQPGDAAADAHRAAVTDALSDLAVDRASGLITEREYARERASLESFSRGRCAPRTPSASDELRSSD
jgi:cytochrome c-type biogenesis protein CcmI